MITQNELKQQLSYNPETGLFTRITKNKGRGKVGDVAGGDDKGYVAIRVYSKRYSAHRLAWLYVYGSFPKGEIDHINGIRSDNRIDNLRDVSHKNNTRNRRKSKLNKSGVTGVYWYKSSGKWRVKISGKSYGLFEDIKDAEKVAKSVYKSLGYHENHGV